MKCDASSDDMRLLRAWRGGDREAAGVLYRRHAPEVQRFFRRREPDSGADLVQETFMALLRRTTGEPATVRGYVMAIANNVLCRHLRRKYKRRREREDFVTTCVRAGGETPAAALEQAELRAALAGALARLSEPELRLLRLRYGEGLSVDETALRLGIPPTAFPGRAQRAKRRLRSGVPAELLGRDGARGRRRGGGGGSGGCGSRGLGGGGRGRRGFAGAGEDPARDLL